MPDGGGNDPSWWHNLTANPVATVTVQGDTWNVIASLVTPSERDKVWAKGVALYPGVTKEGAWARDRHTEVSILSPT